MAVGSANSGSIEADAKDRVITRANFRKLTIFVFLLSIHEKCTFPYFRSHNFGFIGTAAEIEMGSYSEVLPRFANLLLALPLRLRRVIRAPAHAQS